jgi:hypothetical protein
MVATATYLLCFPWSTRFGVHLYYRIAVEDPVVGSKYHQSVDPHASGILHGAGKTRKVLEKQQQVPRGPEQRLC